MNMLQPRLTMSAGDHGRGTLTVTSVCLGLSWIAVLLRCYTRAYLVRRFHWEDWLMILALLFFTPYCGLLLTATAYMNKEFSLTNIVFILKIVMVVEVFYVSTIATLKVSVALLYLRIVTKKWLRYVIIANATLSTAWALAMMFFTIFSCGYFSSMNVYVTRKLEGHCVANSVTLGMSYAHGAVNAFTDWVFVLVPIYIVKGLATRRREKVIVASLMAFASFGAIASLIRLVYVPQALMSAANFNKSELLAIWTTLEQGVGVVAVSASTYRPLARKFFSIQFRWSRGSGADSKEDEYAPGSPGPLPRREGAQSGGVPKVHEAQVKERPSHSDIVSEKSMGSTFKEEEEEEIQVRLASPATVVHARMSPRHSMIKSDGLPLQFFGKRDSAYRDSMV